MVNNQNHVVVHDIVDEMRVSYTDYAMSVIVSRALPDVRDGLKPVHRRILYSMWDEKMTHGHPHKKSAKIVGSVMSKYHPHGDAAIADAIVRMGQDFSMRYPLIDGQGNFGSIDGDPAASMRYLEARMSVLSEEMLVDIGKGTVDFRPNYDDSMEEPSVLPSKIPNLLLNGSVGIAVGMSTNIPPHNLGEVVDAVVGYIDDGDVDLPGPDFPTGGVIVGRSGIRQAYETGRGQIVLRGVYHIEDGKRRRMIVITEIPYQVNKATLVEKIADLVNADTLKGVGNVRDESDREGIRVVIEVKDGFDPEIIVNQLCKYTDMQISFSINMVVLVGGVPKTVGLKTIIDEFVKHRVDVITRATRHDLEDAKKRIHILSGLYVAIGNIDKVISIIRGSGSLEDARGGLIYSFGVSDTQASAILDMKLQRLSRLEESTISREIEKLSIDVSNYEKILADEVEVLRVIKSDLLDAKRRFGDKRRTEVMDVVSSKECDIEDLIQDEDVIVTLTSDGYIKRQLVTAYRSQRRGGKGVTGMDVRAEDCVIGVFPASTKDYLLVFTDQGRAYWIKVYEIPQASRQARGKPVVTLLNLGEGEKVLSILPVKNFSGGYVLVAMDSGNVVKMSASLFNRPRKTGVKAVNPNGDRIVDVVLIPDRSEAMIATKFGKSVRFSEEDIRATGRGAAGVRAIRLGPGDAVIRMCGVRDGASLLSVTSSGLGKRTAISQYPCQRRGGSGVINMKLGRSVVQDVSMISENDEVLITTKNGISIRVPVSSLRESGRATSGVKIIDLADGDEVASVTKISDE